MVTDPIFDIILKVVRDTSEGFRLDIVEQLYKSKIGMSKDDLAEAIGISPSHCNTLLRRDMEPTGIVELVKVNNQSGNRGRNLHLYQLTPELKSICKKVFK